MCVIIYIYRERERDTHDYLQYMYKYRCIHIFICICIYYIYVQDCSRGLRPRVTQHIVALKYVMQHVALLFSDFECTSV